jgi:hypothetical protein
VTKITSVDSPWLSEDQPDSKVGSNVDFDLIERLFPLFRQIGPIHIHAIA